MAFVAWLLLLLCAVALALAAHRWSRLPGDVALAHALQGIEPRGGDPLLRLLNWIGTGTPALVLAISYGALVALRRRLWPLLFYALAQAARPADALLKTVVDRPRPSSALIRVTEHASGTSFPSGHVFSAVLCYGALALLLGSLGLPYRPRIVLSALCLLVVLLMGPARVAVGAHWPSDVLGGWLWGAATLFALRAAVARARTPV